MQRKKVHLFHMDVSENSGTPKSSILIGFSIIKPSIWGTPIFGNTHMYHVFIGDTKPFSLDIDGAHQKVHLFRYD